MTTSLQLYHYSEFPFVLKDWRDKVKDVEKKKKKEKKGRRANRMLQEA